MSTPLPSERAQHAASTFTYGEPLARQHTDAHTWKLAAIIQGAIDAERGEVTDMVLCEQTRVMLRPGQLYRFHAHENCADCQRQAAPYTS